ncbi:MAG: collagen-like protein, partial [Mogibacterium diversum]|nr:collagen-like protein [Mogibacterium diversum]
MQKKALPVRIEGPIKVDAQVKAIMVGDNGKSAYEIAVAHGYKGTESEWLESLRGPKGESFKYTDFTEEQLATLKGERGEKGETGERGRKGPQGDNVNLETVAKIKNLLLDNNVFVKSDSLEGILLEFITAQANGLNFVKDDDVYEP